MNNQFELINETAIKLIEGDPSVQKVNIKFSADETKVSFITQFHDQTKVEYMSTNWDSLDEVLSDCDWMTKDKVYIIHKGLPSLSEHEGSVYTKILEDKIETHKQGPTSEHALPQRKVDFHVIFVFKDENEKKEIEKTIERYSSSRK